MSEFEESKLKAMVANMGLHMPATEMSSDAMSAWMDEEMTRVQASK